MLDIHYKKIIILLSLFYIQVNPQEIFNNAPYPKGKESYAYLMKNSASSFALSIGTSLSQTYITQNTINPEFIRKKMLELAKKMGPIEGLEWLRSEKRKWYLLRSMPDYECSCGFKNISDESLELNEIALLDLSLNFMDITDFDFKNCPKCQKEITKKDEQKNLFSLENQDKIVNLIHNLNVDLLKIKGISNARLSIEISDVLTSGTLEIDEGKLQNLVDLINKIGNPMIFFHHYANPIALSNLFEKEEHAEWFANICARVIEKLPNITHVCPVSQPTGFMFRVTQNQDLPPFEYKVSQDKLLDNIMKASALAADKMRMVRSKINNGIQLKVLVSHQWKIMSPKHAYYDPRYSLELLAAIIADKMYNGKFLKAVQPYISRFDGIALSVYPALKFDLWRPDGSNIAGTVDYDGSLGAVVEANKAFPSKDIYIVEAGCNTADVAVKNDYIDMMLCVCARACQSGIPLKGLYFWAITNHPDFYMEWNTPKRTTSFGPYEGLETDSINQGGKYLKDIINSNVVT